MDKKKVDKKTKAWRDEERVIRIMEGLEVEVKTWYLHNRPMISVYLPAERRAVFTGPLVGRTHITYLQEALKTIGAQMEEKTTEILRLTEDVRILTERLWAYEHKDDAPK